MSHDNLLTRREFTVETALAMLAGVTITISGCGDDDDDATPAPSPQPSDRTGALDEALCFGWVDSLVKRLDDRRFARKFTPRKPDSRWSPRNRQRYGELKALGRMKPAGVQRPPTDRGYGPRPVRLPLPSKLPAYIQAALNKRPVALRHFKALPPSERRRYLAWIESAKKEETKQRRLKEALRLLSAGTVLGLK